VSRSRVTAGIAGRIFFAKIWVRLQDFSTSLRLPKRKDGHCTQGPIVNLQFFSMLLQKPFTELTPQDKAILLHILFPHEIKNLLHFMRVRIEEILQDKQRFENFVLHHKSFPPEKWAELLQLISEHIPTHYQELTANSQTFSNTFTKGHNRFFFLDCLTAYEGHCENEDFAKAILFFFSL
jgi:hypothetical protein